MRKGISALPRSLWLSLSKRAARLRKAETRWRECGETECAAIYQGAAFELELLLEMNLDDSSETPTVEEMIECLLRRGWRKWKGHQTVWKSPDGPLFRGPYLAWCVANYKPLAARGRK